MLIGKIARSVWGDAADASCAGAEAGGTLEYIQGEPCFQLFDFFTLVGSGVS